MSRRYAGLLINVVLLVVAALVYSRLPARVPTHWDLHGDVNGTMPKFPGAFLASLIAIALWFLLPLLRRIDPRRASYEKFDATFFLVVNLVCVLMAVIEGLTLAVSLGMRVDMTRSVMLAAGVMFVVLGNYMPRIRSNWWMGIRTPWTLDNDEVWRRTHRVGGRAFVGAGIVTIVSTLLPGEASLTIGVAAMVVAALIAVVYSYMAWRDEPTREGRRDA
jgi:uncharacterized membrane protein